jgi:predicted phosphate transport protein (TIGR00153 family)
MVRWCHEHGDHEHAHVHRNPRCVVLDAEQARRRCIADATPVAAAVRLRLVPTNPRIIDLLCDAADNMAEAGRLLHAVFAGFPESRSTIGDLRTAERNGDAITRELFELLESTVVSPIDREDAFALASALDDVVDHLDEAADELQLYGIRTVSERAVEQAAVAAATCDLLREAVRRLDGAGDARDAIAQLRARETEADHLYRQAVAALFSGEADPLTVIRWKDIHEELEAAVNAAERAVEVLETISLKSR